MNSRSILIILAIVGGAVAGAIVALNWQKEGNPASIIPEPKHYAAGSGHFPLTASTVLLADAKGRPAAEFLAERLRQAAGFALPVQESRSDDNPVGAISIRITEGPREGYRLQVTKEHVVITGSDEAGAFYGVQTLLQCMPPEIFRAQPAPGVSWSLCVADIEDAPRFGWRGVLLDVARHFFTKDEVKRVMDGMAVHKLNVLHLHLTDDQGWRVQIEKYPKLTEIGAWRKGIGFGLDPKSSTAYRADGEYGGFFTQSDLRELVEYGHRLHIQIVPEIEMPGHATAALTAYPALGCQDAQRRIEMGAGVFAGVFCPAKDYTYEFLKSVLTEVAGIFPSPYIHIGGDEVPKEAWQKCPDCQALMKREGLKNEAELQSYFIRRIGSILKGLDRRLIGWSEMREGGLPPDTTLMDWIGGAVESARSDHDVIMTPTAFCYFDYYQSTNRAAEPKAGGGYVPLPKVYQFEPIPSELEMQFQHRILGTQANLWTEYVPNLRQVEYMLYPRLCALSEVVWSPEKGRSYEGFRKRLAAHLKRLEVMGINYREGIPTAAEAKKRDD